MELDIASRLESIDGAIKDESQREIAISLAAWVQCFEAIG